MDQIAPFCLLLLGQPTLRRQLRLGTFAALDQRVGLRYTIGGLDQAETGSYIAPSPRARRPLGHACSPTTPSR